MATRNIVPRASGEGGIGTSAKHWLNGYFDHIFANAATTSVAGLMSATDKIKIDGIEALADVTDAANVAAAGALMNTTTRYREIHIDAGSLKVSNDEAGYWDTDTLDNGIQEIRMTFTYGGSHAAYAKVWLPADWDGSNLKMRTIWKSADGTLNTFIADVYAARFADAATRDIALSTKVVSITDTNNGAGKVNISAESANFTITGSGNMIEFLFKRGTDTLNADVKLLGIVLKYGYLLT